MNCLEFRRELLVHPQSSDAAFQRHLHECLRCAEAQQRALTFEGQLKSALAIAPPPQLAEAILLRQATAQKVHGQRLRRGGALLALAAGVVLAIGIGIRSQAQPLPELVVQHLNSEAVVLSMTQPLPETDIRNAFAQLGVHVEHLPAGVSFVACCPVGHYASVHLVMPQTNGPVTVLYLTDVAQQARKDFVRDGWLGRSVPLAHGTLVLLAHDASRFDQIEGQWRAALQSAT
jgi:hypothetical protein